MLKALLIASMLLGTSLFAGETLYSFDKTDIKTWNTFGTWKVVGVSLILEVIFFLPFITQNMKKIKKFTRK